MSFNYGREVSRLYIVPTTRHPLAMRHNWIPSLLLTTCCLAWLPSMAQPAAVAPIAPKLATVLPDAPVHQSVAVTPQPPDARPAPAAALVRPVAAPGPLVLLNSSIVIDLTNPAINPNDIDKLRIYKGADAPPQWRPLTAYGIIDITMKRKAKLKVTSRSLAQIGRSLALLGTISYAVNGMPVAGTDLRIANDAIERIDITRAAASSLDVLVDIRIINRIPPPLPPDPSGKPRILIRGTASL
ncbi:hypothetical protein [Hymenobacter convexus]|uniref:hypothetical protein n=1 Tax=Hymenobacter sp. CA1UV-4 TaxID=3063782 RepID=UPI00271227E0|nr:hypothetical protein [Hymenobacter sp. CA1UV-4]MDO7849977.1 hypothetical protein [Hymenobacter sp. CA1UV-4]